MKLRDKSKKKSLGERVSNLATQIKYSKHYWPKAEKAYKKEESKEPGKQISDPEAYKGAIWWKMKGKKDPKDLSKKERSKIVQEARKSNTEEKDPTVKQVEKENQEIADNRFDKMQEVADATKTAKIKHVGDEWQVVSEKGKNMGRYKTKSEALQRLKNIEFFKHKK